MVQFEVCSGQLMGRLEQGRMRWISFLSRPLSQILLWWKVRPTARQNKDS